MKGAELVSIQVGRFQALGSAAAANPFDEPWTTGIFKTPVEGSLLAGPLGLPGDEQADPLNHGGPDKAICVYSADHYETWRAALGIAPFEHGAFGENFTIARMNEDDVCIGDVWAVGEARVQVSQPRQPCWKLARKWRVKDLVDQVVKSGRTGWYLRVIRGGQVQAGDAVTLLERPSPEWSVTAANGVMHHHKLDRAMAAALGAAAGLSESWRAALARRVEL